MKGHSLPGPHQRKSPAKGVLDNVKKHLKGKWDKTTQVAMGVKAGLGQIVADKKQKSDLIDIAKNAYRREKSHDEGRKTYKDEYGTRRNVSDQSIAKGKARTKKSPAKCPLLAAAPAIIGAVGALKKKKEEDSPAKQKKPNIKLMSKTEGVSEAITQAQINKLKKNKGKKLDRTVTKKFKKRQPKKNAPQPR